MAHPLGWMAKYIVGSAVGALTVVQAIKIAQFELGNNVEGLIFRLGLRSDGYEGIDEELR